MIKLSENFGVLNIHDHDTYAVDIHAMGGIVLLVCHFNDFGGDKAPCAQVAHIPVLVYLACPKVRNFQYAIDNQQVVWFDVIMFDVMCV